MRLHTLELENINSLRGPHTIDFEGLFHSSSILLIAGKTGSGKSTILDAIHLALFGRTPRLADPARSVSEDTSVKNVMTRGTGRCHVTLEFSVLSVDGIRERYRAHWQLHRARQNPEGRVQDANTSLERLEDDGETWTDLLKSGEFPSFEAGRDYALRGMKEDDFLRSVMLAQGKFDSLLSADRASRAEALKRVVSVEEYQAIGKKVAEYAREARNDLDRMTARSESQAENMLSDEQRAAYREELNVVTEQKQALDAQLELLQKRVNWAAAQQKLAEELSEATHADSQAKAAVEASAEDAAALREHRRVADAAQKVDKLSKLRTQRSQEESTLERAEKAVKDSEEQIAPLRTKALNSQNAYSLLEAASKERAPLLAEAEAAWEELQKATMAFHLAEKEQARCKASLVDTEAALKTRHETLAKCTAATEEAHARVRNFELEESALKELPNVELLREQLALLRTKLESEAESYNRESRRLEQAKEALKAHEAGQKELDARQSAWLNELRSLCDASSLPGFEVLDLRSAERLRQALEGDMQSLTAYGTQLAGMQKLRIERQALRDELETLSEAVGTKSQEHTRATEQLEAQLAHQESKQGTLRTLERLLTSQQQFLALVDALEPGVDCPLCGSDTHKPSDVRREEMREELNQTEADLRAAQDAGKQLAEAIKLQQVDLQKSRDALTSLQVEIRGKKEALQQRIKDFELAVETLQNDYPAQSKDLALNPEALDDAVENLRSLWRKRSQLQETAKDLCTRGEGLRDAWRDYQSRLSALREQQERLASSHSTMTESFEKLKDEIQRALERSTRFFSTAAFARWTPAEQETLESRLTAHAEQLALVVKQLRDYEAALADWKSHQAQEVAAQKEVALQQENVERLSKEHNEAVELSKKAQTHAKLAQERSKTYFEGRPPRDVREGFDLELTKARDELGAHHEALKTAEAAHIQLVSACTVARTVLSGTSSQLEERLTAFQEELLRLELADEAAVLERRLDGELAEEIEADLKKLDDARRNATLRLANVKERLEAHQNVRADIGEPEENDAETLDLLREKRDELVALATKRSLQLKNDEELAQKLSSWREQLEALTRERDEWAQLNSLIGVNQGAAFVEFALALSLGTLIAHANEQLKHIAPRYVLQQRFSDANVPEIDFQVIDRDFSDQVRPVTNISGGERFQISLALALGLSSMSRSVLQVETLLIDEGFGTLDPDTLNQAIQTLEGLYQRTGARVALISHVERLRERLPTQILVRKLGGGHSSLESLDGYGVNGLG